MVKAARQLQTQRAMLLLSRLGVRDKGGMCHQLANDDKVKWTK